MFQKIRAFVTNPRAFFSKKAASASASSADSQAETVSPLADVQKRQQVFRLFLNAWNGFQETMTSIEYTLCCAHPFGMYRVQALCTAVATQVFLCMQHLANLTGQKPTALRERFSHLHELTSGILAAQDARIAGQAMVAILPNSANPFENTGDASAEYCVDPATVRYARSMQSMPAHSSPAFALTAACCQGFFQAGGLYANIQKYILECGGMTPRTIWKIAKHAETLVMQSSLPPELERDFFAHIQSLREVCPDRTTQILFRGRLWPLAPEKAPEDAHTVDNHSDYGLVFWGPLVELYADDDALVCALQRTLARRFSTQSLMYLRYRGLTPSSAGVCVLALALPCVRMSGIVYSNNPLQTTNNTMFMYACRGLPKVMEGTPYVDDTILSSMPAPLPAEEHEDDTLDEEIILPNPVEVIHVTRRPPHEANIQHALDKNAPLVDAALSQTLAQMALDLESAEGGKPQSMTWVLCEDGSVRVVMSRPMVLAKTLDVNELPENTLPKPMLNWGLCASPGIASGPVYHVRTIQDAKKFPSGGVLVIERDTYPWAALLDRASAVIASQGFWGSRMTSIAREFGKPMIIDLPHCMDALKPLERVTVYADAGSVYHDNVPALMEHHTAPKDFLPGSHIYATLRDAAQHILPLTLDPESADFLAKNCHTYHDVARYCQEKAVGALFAFGSHKDNAAQRVRQLFDGGPKQFWLIDVDNAFENPPYGPTIEPQYINSPPLHSLWHGINAFPWQGPPAVDSKGLLAIFYEATANPHLDPAAQSAHFSEKNYMLVGREYCSLFSRFGFHFVSVEARLGRQKSENALVFQLRGGAANIERRILRVRFVAELLWECGLKPEITHDAVRARAAGLDRAETLALTSVLGYLTIHTRQLDMIMCDTAQVAALRSRLTNEYKTLLCA